MKRAITTAWLGFLLHTSSAFAQSDAGKTETYTERYRAQFRDNCSRYYRPRADKSLFIPSPSAWPIRK